MLKFFAKLRNENVLQINTTIESGAGGYYNALLIGPEEVDDFNLKKLLQQIKIFSSKPFPETISITVTGQLRWKPINIKFNDIESFEKYLEKNSLIKKDIPEEKVTSTQNL
ncbi:MAG TPA: hypothetical protein VHM20_04890 [Gammaproteobacteria bacterium]|jgi:hypothetical protein|nr:hypothetical protein [Gammaproteobacteria bacterium]